MTDSSDTPSDGGLRDNECRECGHVEKTHQDVGDGKAYLCSECGEVWKVEHELVADGGTDEEEEYEWILGYHPDDVADLENINYESDGDRHVIQLEASVTYEFEITDMGEAEDLAKVAQMILHSMDAPTAGEDLSPTGVHERAKQ